VPTSTIFSLFHFPATSTLHPFIPGVDCSIIYTAPKKVKRIQGNEMELVLSTEQR